MTNRLLLFTLATTLIATTQWMQAEPKSSKQPAAARQSDFPNNGTIYVDIETDKTGAVARLIFLNDVPIPIQEDIKKNTMGRHFGVPNHTYRRHVRYEVPKPSKPQK
jgi:hypothetical protein